jgi:hypothetical protein
MKKLVSILMLFFLSTSVFFAQSDLKTKDYQSIQNVLAYWNQLQDDGNLDGFMELWASSPSFTNPFGLFKSTEEIKGFEQNYLNGFAKGKRHLGSNAVITATGSNSAKAVVDFMVVEVNEIPFILANVRANMELVEEGGSWKLKTVTLSLDEGFNKLMESTQKQ